MNLLKKREYLEKKELKNVRKINKKFENKLHKLKKSKNSKALKVIAITGSCGKSTTAVILHENLKALGYYIADETLVKDKNIIYTVIKFSKGKKKYNYKELYLGPILISKNDDLFKEKNKKEINTLRMIVNGIGNGHYFYKKRLKRNIRILEKIGT